MNKESLILRNRPDYSVRRGLLNQNSGLAFVSAWSVPEPLGSNPTDS